MNFLLVDIPNNTELLETTDCCEAVEATIAKVENGVQAELYLYRNEQWYTWNNEFGFIGPRPKNPPTRI
jgi:hypothetical protein